MGGARAALFLLVAAVLCIQVAAVTDPKQQQALIDFKNKVVNKTRIESWNKTGDACADKWVGITCDAAKRDIIEINLTFFNLTVNGIPATFNNLIKCQNFMLNGNIIKGHLPLLNKCVALKIFRVKGGELSGGIPANFLASNSKPEVINLSNNRLSSLIPKSLFQFPSLMTILTITRDLSGNRLNGQLPSMSKLTKITLFLVGDNQISGSLPNDVKTANLVNFNTSYNRLSGRIPLVLATNTPNLVTLDLSHNKLSGNIPQNLFKSSKVQVPIMIVLANNSLSGKLPDNFVATIEDLDSDQNRVNSLIDLSGNNLGGVVPKALVGSHSYVLFLDGNPKLVIPAVPVGPPPGAPSKAPTAAPQPPAPALPPALPSPVASPTALPSPPPPAFAGPTPAPLGSPTTTPSAPSPAAPPVGAASPPPLVVGTPTSSPAAAPVTSFPPPPLLITLPPARAPTATPFPPPLASGPAAAPATSPPAGGGLPPPPPLRFEPPAPPPAGGDAAAFPAQFCLMLAIAVLSSTLMLL
eukprot:SM000120S25681  [mRNA]  locus=s120:51425:55412:+ [translate_table: standard]